MRQIWRGSRKVLVMVFGITIIVFGALLLVLPGPGLLVIIAGLAVLATEFTWAQTLLHKAKHHYHRAKSKVTDRLPVKVANKISDQPGAQTSDKTLSPSKSKKSKES